MLIHLIEREEKYLVKIDTHSHLINRRRMSKQNSFRFCLHTASTHSNIDLPVYLNNEDDCVVFCQSTMEETKCSMMIFCI